MTILKPLDINFTSPYKKYDYGVWKDTGKACEDNEFSSAVRMTGCKMWRINMFIGIIVVLILFYNVVAIIYYYASGDELITSGQISNYKTYYPVYTGIFMMMSLYFVNMGVLNSFGERLYKSSYD